MVSVGSTTMTHKLKILSVNVSMPRDVQWKGEIISTGIFKEPVARPVNIGRLNLEGDGQADLTVHGGADKAVYGYAAEHYAPWKAELGGQDLPWGMFGENLTIEGGLLEHGVFVGDRFRIGTAEVLAVQPRLPCFKLGIRFGTQSIVKKFAQAGRFGVYFRVLKEGQVCVDDDAEKIGESAHGVSIGELGRMLLGMERNARRLEQAAAIKELPGSVQDRLLSLLQRDQTGSRE
jgi:MOSC domain-containing protein YiiM